MTDSEKLLKMKQFKSFWPTHACTIPDIFRELHVHYGLLRLCCLVFQRRCHVGEYHPTTCGSWSHALQYKHHLSGTCCVCWVVYAFSIPLGCTDWDYSHSCNPVAGYRPPLFRECTHCWRKRSGQSRCSFRPLTHASVDRAYQAESVGRDSFSSILIAIHRSPNLWVKI